MRARWWLCLAAIACASEDSLLPGDDAFPAYHVVDLTPLVSGDSVTFVAMNDSMQFAGNRFVDGAWHGFVLDAETLTDLPCLASGMNASGDVACLVDDRPNLWRDGTLTQLLDDSVAVESAKLTDSGIVYGALGGGSWRSLDGNYETLRFGLGPGTANNLGDVPVSSLDLYPVGFVWYAEAGSGTTTLGTFGRYSLARAINDAGDLVGMSEVGPGSGTVAVVARKGTGRTDSLVTPGFRATEADYINNHDLILGTGTKGIFLMRGSDVALVNDLLASPVDIARIVAFTDGGRILARKMPYVTGDWVVIVPQ